MFRRLWHIVRGHDIERAVAEPTFLGANTALSGAPVSSSGETPMRFHVRLHCACGYSWWSKWLYLTGTGSGVG